MPHTFTQEEAHALAVAVEDLMVYVDDYIPKIHEVRDLPGFLMAKEVHETLRSENWLRPLK